MNGLYYYDSKNVKGCVKNCFIFKKMEIVALIYQGD